jgi:protein-S-isoprenylcysteine O-methyltransferase Ste14
MRRRLFRWLFAVALVGGCVLGVSGQWKDPWLWTYTGLWAVLAFYALFSIDEDLARERFASPTRGEDTRALRAIRIIALAHVVVGALDTGRWHLTTVPSWLRAVGVAGCGASTFLVFRAMLANRFFSAVVRVQRDRGHHVVDTGPYAAVRHPGYAGMILAVPFSALALGSWVSFALALVYSAMIFRRVLFEDGYLRANLEGYDDYARRVRYRLLPGAW